MNGHLLTQVFAQESPFALVDGLPVHPLVVHAAVVFIPLAALGLILIGLIPRLAVKLGWLVALTAAVAFGAAFVTAESGEALAELIGEPGFDHAEWGDRMPVVAGVLFATVIVVWLVQRMLARRESGGGLIKVLVGLISVVVAGASLFMVFKTGDTGARSVWEGEISAVGSEPTAEPTSGSATTGAAPSPTPTATYTAAQVATHNSPGDCWTSINGVVYNVTDWEDKHPGGAARIQQLCGIDGTSLFDGQHEGEPKPEQILAGYEVGVLG